MGLSDKSSSPSPRLSDEEKLPDFPIVERTYIGSGTAKDPYVVDWDLNDPEDPYNWSKVRKWVITMQASLFRTYMHSFFNSVNSWPFLHGLCPSPARRTLAALRKQCAIYTYLTKLLSLVYLYTF